MQRLCLFCRKDFYTILVRFCWFEGSMLRWSLKLGGKILEPTFWIFLTTYIYSILVPMDCRQKTRACTCSTKIYKFSTPRKCLPNARRISMNIILINCTPRSGWRENKETGVPLSFNRPRPDGKQPWVSIIFPETIHGFNLIKNFMHQFVPTKPIKWDTTIIYHYHITIQLTASIQY